MDLYHGSKKDFSEILESGLDPAGKAGPDGKRFLPYVTPQESLAAKAAEQHRRPGDDAGVVVSRVPESDYKAHVEPLMRSYEWGAGGANPPGSMQAKLETPEAIHAFNRGISRFDSYPIPGP